MDEKEVVTTLEAATGLLVHLFSENQKLKAEVDKWKGTASTERDLRVHFKSLLKTLEEENPDIYVQLVEHKI